jgi:hypothetical protein
MPGEIAPNNSSQYDGRKGKTNVMLQGQTDSGSYASNIDAKRRTPDVPKDLSI